MADRHRQTPFPLRIKEPSAKEWIKQTARRSDRSQNWVINQLIEEAMRREDEGTAA